MINKAVSSIVLVKIGGSLITDKNKPFKVNKKALENIASEVKKTIEKSGKQVIIGHGGGSFPHVPAKKYQTHKGVINDKSYRGIVEVQDAAARLNRIIVSALLKKKVNAISINSSSCFIVENDKIKRMFLEPIKKLLDFQMLPILYGDVALDLKKGCTILSTEKILGFLGQELIKNGFKVEKIIHCGQTNGVYDENGKTIPLINSKNIEKYRKILGGSGGIDVTGGMTHKVEQSLKMAKLGIPALIIDGIEKGTLSKAVLGKKILGTRIEK